MPRMTQTELSAYLASPTIGIPALDANTIATFVHPLLTAGQTTGAQVAAALQTAPPAGLGLPVHEATAIADALYSEWIRGPAGVPGAAGAQGLPGRNAPVWVLVVGALLVIGAGVLGSIALVNGFTIDGNAQIRESEIADATKTDLAAVKADLATTKTELAAVKINATTALAKANTVETTVGQLSSTLGAHATRLDQLTGAVNGHTTELAALTTTVNGKADASAVAGLETKVTRYKWQLAKTSKELRAEIAKVTPKVEEKKPAPTAVQPAATGGGVPQAKLTVDVK